jgi:hypothetical protein
VQKIPTPPFANPGDVGELVGDAGRNQDPPRLQNLAASETDEEPGRNRRHVISDQLYAVTRHLGPTRREQIGGGYAVSGQEALHVSRRSVTGRSGIDHRNAASGSAQHERRAQSCRSASDHHYVVNLCVHHDSSLASGCRRARDDNRSASD